jgi:hypothetical protein
MSDKGGGGFHFGYFQGSVDCRLTTSGGERNPASWPVRWTTAGRPRPLRPARQTCPARAGLGDRRSLLPERQAALRTKLSLKPLIETNLFYPGHRVRGLVTKNVTEIEVVTLALIYTFTDMPVRDELAIGET